MISGYCQSATNGKSANVLSGKRDLDLHGIHVSGSDVHSELGKRDVTTYEAILYTGTIILVMAANYPPIGRLYLIANRNQVLKKAFRLLPGYCLGSAVFGVPMDPYLLNALYDLQAEHPVDVCMKLAIDATRF